MQRAVKKGKVTEGYFVEHKDGNFRGKAAETSNSDCSEQGREEQEKIVLFRVPRGVPTFQAWHSGASPLIEEAMRRGNFSKFYVLQDSVLYGDAQLWIVAGWKSGILAAAVTEVDGDRCTISACGGRERPKWLHMINQLEEYALSMGCTSTRIIGRKGWLRLLPKYRQSAVVIERTL